MSKKPAKNSLPADFPEGWRVEEIDSKIYTFDEKGQPVCGAKKRKKGYCRAYPMKNRNRCRLHGGASPVGFDHPRTTTGRYSKHIGASSLAERYHEAIRHPELLSLREDIALNQAYMMRLINESNTHAASGAAWAAASKKLRAYKGRLKQKDQEGAMVLLEELDEILKEGATESARWVEIRTTQEANRKMAHTEMQRIDQMEQSLTVEQAMDLLQTVIKIIRENVVDAEVQRTIANAITQHIMTRRRITEKSGDVG